MDAAKEFTEAKAAFAKAKYYKNSDPRKMVAKEAMMRAESALKECKIADGISMTNDTVQENKSTENSSDPLADPRIIEQGSMIVENDTCPTSESNKKESRNAEGDALSQGTPSDGETQEMVIDPSPVNEIKHKETLEEPPEVFGASSTNCPSEDAKAMIAKIASDEGEREVLDDPKKMLEQDGLISFPSEPTEKRESPEPEFLSPQSLKLALAAAMQALENPGVQSVAQAVTILRQITLGPQNKVESPDDVDDSDDDTAEADSERELKSLIAELKGLKKEIVCISNSIVYLTGESKAVLSKDLEGKRKLLSEIETKIEEIKARPKKTLERPLKRKKHADANDEDVPAGADKWDRLDDDQRLKFEEDANSAFGKYCRTQNASHFSASFKRAVLMVPNLVPEAATTSREAAVMVHTNSFLNVVCRFHVSDKKYARDGMLISDNRIHGVAYKGDYGNSKAPVIPRLNHMNCGCLISDVLLEFFLWKTIKIRSSNPRLPGVEGLGNEILHPRKRAYMVQVFHQFTGLTVDDLYTNGSPMDDAYIAGLRVVQATRCVLELQKMGIQATLQLPGMPPQDESHEE